MSVLPVASSARPFHIVAKPVGPICNLNCKYCFYLEKKGLYPDERRWRMSDEVLAQYVRQYIQSQPQEEISFAWQGGEPTLLGVDFFRQVVELQRKYAGGKRICNALQTNGTLLDDRWCEFFTANGFLVGLSIDGPREAHDRYRVDRRGRPTFDAVMRGLELLKKHKTDFNTLTVVNRANSRKPLEVYRFLKQVGSGYVQFIPLVERSPPRGPNAAACDLAEPPGPGAAAGPEARVTGWSVPAGEYGRFLCAIYDEWVRNDVGKVSVQLFEVALGCWIGLGSSLCVFARTCGAAMALEHNGDLYSCDHYVYPKYRLGNILHAGLADLAGSPRQMKFGADKLDTLPRYCRECAVRFACNGGCPKHRFTRAPNGEPGLSYLCPAYKRFFGHVGPSMSIMAHLARSGRPAAAVMDISRYRERCACLGAVGRNDPCPCGSGRKYKKCCGADPR
jgi:uncharacterized protein